MTVAVKNSPETISRRPINRLAVESLLGAGYLLGCVGVIFYLLPALWWGLFPSASTPVMTAILSLIMVVVVGAACYGGWRLLGQNPPKGLATGAFVAVAGFIVIILLALFVGRLLEPVIGAGNSAIGLAAMAIVATILFVVGVRAYFQPRFDMWLTRTDEQGWFTIKPYKRSQGQRVRRGTIIGILVLAGAGIYTLLAHNILPADSWQLRVPFLAGRSIALLPDVRYTLPLLLAFVSFWVAYRVVNFPVFADFLIATEAEMNKVSWTTRPRLIQDTIVVLVTVLLLAIFLFAVDQLWIWFLSQIGVIQFPTGGAGTSGPGPIPY